MGHYRRDPMYTYARYSLTLPNDIPDGDYDLNLCSVAGHLSALRAEKPFLFRAETLSEALNALNLLGSYLGDRLYMRLSLKRGGLAYKQLEMPDLPGSRRKILSDARLTADVTPFSGSPGRGAPDGLRRQRQIRHPDPGEEAPRSMIDGTYLAEPGGRSD